MLNPANRSLVLLACVCLWPCAALAIEDRADMLPNEAVKPGQSLAWKATFARYQDTEQGLANDVNLRANTADNSFWLGSYSDSTGFNQTRAGAEHSADITYGRVITSLQLASAGFVGASLTWDGKRDGETGLSPLLGWGRTNLKPYYNLNFDPNDSVLWGGTYTGPAIGQLSLFQIFDDRLATQQRVTHLVWRRALAPQRRITADLFARQGASQAGQPVVRGNGAALTLDIHDYFVRLAYDQKANFGTSNMTRLALGLRF